VNYILMVCCVAVVAGFQDTTALGHAYGVAVVSVMLITTFMFGLVALVGGPLRAPCGANDACGACMPQMHACNACMHLTGLPFALIV
jgi:K+ potassium transporter